MKSLLEYGFKSKDCRVVSASNDDIDFDETEINIDDFKDGLLNSSKISHKKLINETLLKDKNTKMEIDNKNENKNNEDKLTTVAKVNTGIRFTKEIKQEIEFYQKKKFSRSKIIQIFIEKYGYAPTYDQISRMNLNKENLKQKNVIIYAKNFNELIASKAVAKFKIKSKYELFTIFFIERYSRGSINFNL
jgi:hypothetical protein